MNTKNKGDIGEAYFAYICSVKGWICAKTPERAPYDFFLEKDGKVFRVQVKYRTSVNGVVEIKLNPSKYNKNNHADYTDGSIDCFAIFEETSKRLALIDIAELVSSNFGTFTLRMDESTGNSASRYFSKYEITI